MRVPDDALVYRRKTTSLRSMVRALDIGGLIWEGKPRYPALDAALQDLDQALRAWFKAEMRE